MIFTQQKSDTPVHLAQGGKIREMFLPLKKTTYICCYLCYSRWRRLLMQDQSKVKVQC